MKFKYLLYLVIIFLLIFLFLPKSKVNDVKDTTYVVNKQWLNEKIEVYKDSTQNKMKMGVSTSLIVGEGILTKEGFDNLSLADGLFDAVIESGTKIVRVGAVNDAWVLGNEKEIEEADKLIKRLQDNNISLFFWDWQFSSVLNENKLTWEEYKKLHLEEIEFFINRYNPDYYSIVTEPIATQAYKVKEPVSLENWVDHITEMTDYLKAKYPNIKLAVLAVPDEDDAFLQGVLNIENLDIIGIELYYPNHIEALERYLENYHPHNFGKEIWLLETWAGMPYPYTEIENKEDEDIKWLELMVKIARKNNFDGFMPWPWIYFISYDKNIFSDQNPDYSQRTKIFEIYKELIHTIDIDIQ